MVNYVEALKEIRRVSEKSLARRSSHTSMAALAGMLEGNMIYIRNFASSTLEVCGELYWSKYTTPDAIADVIRAEAEELLECSVKWVCVGDSGETDIGYELISDNGNFCFAVRLEGSMWRVYSLPIDKQSQPLKNVGELIKETCDNEK